MSEAAECFEMWGSCSSAQPCAYPYTNFPKCPLTSLQPSQCIVCQLSICGNASVGSCSGSPASWCFLGSSWVVWGQKMCSLKSLMSLVLSNTSVKALPVQIFVWGGGGLWIPLPPCSATYAWVRVTALRVLVKFFLSCVLLRWIVNISEHKSRPYACLAILTKKPWSLKDLIILQR